MRAVFVTLCVCALQTRLSEPLHLHHVRALLDDIDHQFLHARCVDEKYYFSQDSVTTVVLWLGWT